MKNVKYNINYKIIYEVRMIYEYITNVCTLNLIKIKYARIS